MTEPVPQHEVYRTCMVEAKLRLVAAEKVCESPHSLTGLPALDNEFCFLQLRLIVEVIAFSAMIREQERYRKLRDLNRQQNPRDHGTPSKDWNAPEILKRLASLSPHALPIPIAKATRHDSGLVHFDQHQISVNHGRLIELYERCGGYMHGKSPLVEDFASLVAAERAKYGEAPNEIRRSLVFLRKLLWRHAVVQLDWTNPENPKSPDGPRSAWIVDFGANESQDVTLVLAEAT